ncbi:hypothetical protein M2103_000366 [Ereboglobus sp. PH5-5]|uniref:hypothetical protein n=1 Tax=Ereboglobus sp. PH5-5 TaxID=2940529 RepID=UPI002405FD62|nr:hypothetical protein [Ereboglobus sp. PH5-5]MDF9832158.1 hypothetical protein [Ereboglobus sp. PH5-5]
MKKIDYTKCAVFMGVYAALVFFARAQDFSASATSTTAIDHKSLNYFLNDFHERKKRGIGGYVLVEQVEALRDVVRVVKHSEQWLAEVRSFAEKTGNKRIIQKADNLLDRLKKMNVAEVEQEMNTNVNIGKPYLRLVTSKEMDKVTWVADRPSDVASRRFQKIGSLKKELMKFNEEYQAVLNSSSEGKVIAGLFPLRRHKNTKTEEIIFTPTSSVEEIAYRIEMIIYTILKQNNILIMYNLQIYYVIHVSTLTDSLKESGSEALKILKEMHDDYKTTQIPIYENMLDLLNKMNENTNTQTVGNMKAFMDEHFPKIYSFFWEKYLKTAYLYRHHIQAIMAAEKNIATDAGDALRHLLFDLNDNRPPFPFPKQSSNE